MQIHWYTSLSIDSLNTDRFLSAEDVSVQANWDSMSFNAASANMAQSGIARASASPVTVRKVTLDIVPDDASYRYRAIMQVPQLIVKFSLPRYVEIPVGAWCEFQGQKYYLNCPEDLKKQGERNIEYSITMGTAQDNLKLYKMWNIVDHRLKWSMCAKPKEFIEEIVKNLNLRDYGEATTEGIWRVGDCITANDKTIEFNHTYLIDALSSVASTFETEWEIVENVDNNTYTIKLGKIEYLKDDPLDLSYGKGKGFVPGVGRSSQSDKLPIMRLYTQGTDRNIDRSKNDISMYGATVTESDTTSPELRLPSAQKILYDGNCYAYLDDSGNIVSPDIGFQLANARCYITDRDGFYIERYYRTGETQTKARKEDSLDCSEIYPSFYSHPTKINEEVGGNPNFYDIYDTTIDNELNFSDYIIEGENMTMIFQSGMLAGKEFEVRYTHDRRIGGNLSPVRKFEIVPQEIDGEMMPNSTYKPTTDDEYAIFGIMLPPAYICNNTTHKGAAWDMLREAVKHFYDNEQQAYTYKGELQSLWSKSNWLRIGGYMNIGAYINFTDRQFAPEGELIRIIGIKEYINSPHAPIIEISNSTTSASTVGQTLGKINNTEVIISDIKSEMQQYTRRRWRDAKETLTALQEAMSSNFSEGINPITVETMAALIGDESLQFRFIDTNEDGNGDTYYIETNLASSYNTLTGLSIGHCYLQHLTLNQDMTAVHDYSSGDYDIWEIGAYQSNYLDPAIYGRLYLYAVCPTVSNTTGYRQGEFTLSEDALPFDGGDVYNMLVGILSSEYDGQRSFVTVYGFTEILPGRITTNKIISTDGLTYFDLVNSEIGGNITFLSPDNNKRTLIQGGYINTDAIDTNSLTARKIITQSSTPAHTHIEGEHQYFYDQDGELRLHVHPGQVNWVDSGQLPAIFSVNETTYTINDPDYLSFSQHGNDVSIRSTSGVQIDLAATWVRRDDGMATVDRTATAWLELYYQIWDNVNNDWEIDEDGEPVLHLITQSDMIEKQVGEGKDEVRFAVGIDYIPQIVLPAGKQRFAFRLRQTGASQYDLANITFKRAFTLTLVSARYWSEIGANGGALRAAADRYIMAIDDKVELCYGSNILRIDANGIRGSSDGGTNWESIFS